MTGLQRVFGVLKLSRMLVAVARVVEDNEYLANRIRHEGARAQLIKFERMNRESGKKFCESLEHQPRIKASIF